MTGVNIQIFGRPKCFDTKKAERYFKERRVRFQAVDLSRHAMSRREIESVKASVGLDAMTDYGARGAEILRYLAHEADREEKLLENPGFIKTPIVRNGRAATVGYRPEVWGAWADGDRV
jgi:arsenate reductase-like glutaredoxin family protein